ncbi:MAG: hypothetical protein WDZ63_06485 [Burkholderiales bacterium]
MTLINLTVSPVLYVNDSRTRGEVAPCPYRRKGDITMKTDWMTHCLKTIALAAMLALPLAAPAQDEHAAHHPESEAADNAEAGRSMMMMDRQMQKMRDMMDRMRQTTDADKRRRLMQDHMQAMREGMKMMHGMRGEMGSMTSDGKSGEMTNGMSHAQGDGAGESSGMMGGQMMMGMMKRHRMMQKRMEMMESMMEQMLEHEAMERELETR